MEELIIIIGGIAGFVLLILYSAFSWGFVLFKFWYWFILPIFTSVPHIDISAAIGLMLVIGLFKSTDMNELTLNDVKIEKKPSWIATIIFPWVLLLMGWFIHLFI